MNDEVVLTGLLPFREGERERIREEFQNFIVFPK